MSTLMRLIQKNANINYKPLENETEKLFSAPVISYGKPGKIDSNVTKRRNKGKIKSHDMKDNNPYNG